MVFLDPSEYTDFQRGVVEKVNAALPAILPSYTPERKPHEWNDIEVVEPIRWAAGEAHALWAQEKGSTTWVEIRPDQPWWSQTQKNQPPLGFVHHIHARCEVRARVNGIHAWTQLEALAYFEHNYQLQLERAFSRTYVRECGTEWAKGPHGVVLYTELDGIVGAIVDEDGDDDYDYSHTYENTADGWKEIE